MSRITICYNTDVEPPPDALEREIWDEWQTVVETMARSLRGYDHVVEIAPLLGDDLFAFADELADNPPDAIVNLCESLGTDSRAEAALPTLLDTLGIPYTGTNALGLNLALHKHRSKALLTTHGVPTPAYAVIERAADVAGAAAGALPYPAIVKPVHEDGSYGIEFASVVHGPDELVRHLERVLAEWDQPALVERYIDGREISVPVIGRRPHRALPFVEALFGPAFADRPRIVTGDAKWDEDCPEFTPWVPCELDGPVAARVAAAALAGFDALGCRDYARIDIRLSDSGEPYVIDVNPNCEVHPRSQLAKSAGLAGIDYDALIGLLVGMALERRR